MRRRRDISVVWLLAVALVAACAFAVIEIRSTLVATTRRAMLRTVEQHGRYVARVVASGGDPVPELRGAYAEYANDLLFARAHAGFLLFRMEGELMRPVAATRLVEHLLSAEGFAKLGPELQAHLSAGTAEPWVARDHRGVELMLAEHKLPNVPYVVVVSAERARVERPLLLTFLTTGAGVCAVLCLLFWSLWRARTGLADSQRALELAAAHRAQLLDQMRSLVFSLDPDGRVAEWNKGAARTLGVPRAEAVGREIAELPIRWDASLLLGGLVNARSSERAIDLDPIAILREDGSSAQLGLTVNMVRDVDGAPEMWLVVGADITKKLQVETELRHSQKMRAIGQLAAGIAHEINTPAQFISDNLRFLREEVPGVLEASAAQAAALRAAGVADPAEKLDLAYLREELPAALDQSLDGISRVAQIVRAMKNVSHPDEAAMSAVDLHEVLETALTVSHSEWKLIASIEKSYAGDLPAIRGMQTDLIQVVLNLVVNACHAIADAKREQGVIGLSTALRGSAVELRVSDNGTGMSDEVRARIFEPFFTTKEVGRGTGQGLAIVYEGVVSRHSGMIDVESEPGVGTTFIVRLPTAG